ncbi:MAG: NAD(+)/NADH kinase [Crenarchaeota archaeon]|nr:NAD(+)/NADH kinase [Thermoproteota archaeon]
MNLEREDFNCEKPKIVIFVSPREEARVYLGKINEILRSRGWQILQIVNVGDSIDKHLLSICDFALVLGGDGTMLYASREVSKYGTPILGVNLGRMGLLTELSPDEFLLSLEKIELGKYSISEVLKIAARTPKKCYQPALNEYTLMTSKPGKVVGLQIFVNEGFLTEVLCDGLIISTPVGSTSYALSAGGPIVSEYLKAMVIVPIAPLYRGMAPLVLPSNCIVKVKVKPGWADAYVVADGQVLDKIVASEHIEFTEAEEKAKFIRVQDPLNRVRKVVNITNLSYRG